MYEKYIIPNLFNNKMRIRLITKKYLELYIKIQKINNNTKYIKWIHSFIYINRKYNY